MNLKKLFTTAIAAVTLLWAAHAGATCSNYTAYSDGQVLTASSLNALQTSYTNCVNAILDGDTFTGDMNWHSGTDIKMYSDTGFTLKFQVDGADGNIETMGNIVAMTAQMDGLPAGETSNCGITYASDTLTITAEDGTALSATNPCCVGVPGATAGQTGTVCFTAAVSSTFSTASDTDGNTFGVTATVSWAQDIGFYLYACRGSASNYWAFSRDPTKYETGDAAGDMCQEGDEDCDTYTDLFIMTSGLTLASEVDMPCTRVGAFRGQWDTTDDHWDATALGDSDGIGRDRVATTCATEWIYPAGQNGNQAGDLYNVADGATALDVADQSAVYKIDCDTGMVDFTFRFKDIDAAGADGTAIYVYLPIPVVDTAAGNLIVWYGTGLINGKDANSTGQVVLAASDGAAYASMRMNDDIEQVDDNFVSISATQYVIGSLHYDGF